VIGRVGTCSCSCCSLATQIGHRSWRFWSYVTRSRFPAPVTPIAARARRARLAGHAQSDAATRGVGSVFGPTGDVSALASRTRRAPLDVPAPAPGPAAAGTAAARADRSARTGEPAPRYQRIAGELKRLGLAASPTTCARCWPPLGIPPAPERRRQSWCRFCASRPRARSPAISSPSIRSGSTDQCALLPLARNAPA
jgi:hypothetical protein